MSEGPASRQKSCDACVKAKRKCGMQLPSCARCSTKNISCVYPKRIWAASPPEPEQAFSWADDLFQPSGILPWSGNLQSELSHTSSVPEYLISPESPMRTTLARLETETAVHHFKSWPDKWLKEGAAPFIHPQLYASSLPKPLQDAYAACAIYTTKTPANHFIAFDIIEAKATELLRSPDKPTWNPLELLSAVQALLIFQFIRLFDGDIRQRALAESAELTLQSWTDELDTRTLEEQQFSSTTAPSWRTWVFAESVRRTITMSFFLTGIYSLVKQGFCTVSHKVTGKSFTAQRLLWEAASELEWQRVKTMCNPYWIEKMDFQDVLRQAKGTELDDFGIMLLITYNGKDVIDNWVAISSAEWGFVEVPDIRQSLENIVQVDGTVVPRVGPGWT